MSRVGGWGFGISLVLVSISGGKERCAWKLVAVPISCIVSGGERAWMAWVNSIVFV